VNFDTLIQTVLVYALPVVFAITVHEAAHGYVARHFGDNTAYLLGRVTLNPLKHIDPLGTVVLPIVLYLSIGLPFGYAKPVPVQFGRLRDPKRDMVWVALAGPGANFAQALLWGIALYLLVGLGVREPFFLKMCQAGMLVNVVMFALNLFPLPPLDGGRVLVGLLPFRQASMVARVEPWGFFIVMGLIVLGILNTIWMQPVMQLSHALLDLLLSPFQLLIR